VPPKGYVEPVPEFYARLAALAQMTHRGLDERGLVPELRGSGDDSELALAVAALADLGELSLELKAMAEKELTGRPLSEEEYSRIRFYGGELERFTFAAADEGGAGDGIPMTEEEPQAAVIADVHTDPDPNCDGGSDDAVVLEEAIGRIFAIYVVVPIEGELIIAKGGVFSYYEFPWPADDRLTDEKWREMLDKGEAPPLPEWTTSFRVDETEEAALREAVWGFNQQWTAALWWPEPSYMDYVATGEALEQSQAHAQSLVDEQRYEGQYLVRLEYLSFDLQDADHAIVTTRETWWAELYEIVGEDWEPGEVTATRPEHTIGVIYHLERIDGRWLVSKTLIEGEIPAWEEVG
jgi:hypothetical protein